jgi:CheY-like chemotaxis protein
MQSHKDMRCETRSNESLNGIVLLVDDDPLTRFLTRQALEQCGLLVEEAENGRQALDLYEKTPPDIVLMDVMMPLMDGFARVTGRLRPGHNADRVRGRRFHCPCV